MSRNFLISLTLYFLYEIQYNLLFFILTSQELRKGADYYVKEKDIFENHCHCFDHGGYGYTQVPVPQTERWIVHKENEDSNDKK